MKLFKKQQAFSEYFSAFLRFRSNFAHFQKKKKMTLIADVFPNLWIPKNIVR